MPDSARRLVELRGEERASEVLGLLRRGDVTAAFDDALVREFITVARPDRVVAELAAIPGVDTVVPVPVGLFAPIVAARLGFDMGRFGESRKALVQALLG